MQLMTTHADAGPADRRGQTKESIDRLLARRQQVLVHYERVAGVQPYEDDPPDADLLKKFSQLLMDYIALGHFGLYQRITEGSERRSKVLNVAEKIYPHIALTTEKALDFNDAYDQTDKSAPFEALSERLSALGEVLAHRIEMEDRLIAAMLAPKNGA
jgi:regulator of sigma D